MKKTSILICTGAILAIGFTGCSVSLPSPHGGLHHDPTPTMVPPGRVKTEVNYVGLAEPFDHVEMIGDFSHTFAVAGGSNLIASLEGGYLFFENFANGKPDFEDRGLRGGLEWKSPISRNGDPERYPTAWTVGVGYGSYPEFVDYADAHAGIALGGRWGKAFTPFFAGMAGASVPLWRKTFDYAYPSLEDVLIGDTVVTPDEFTRYRYAPALWLEGTFGVQTDFGLKKWGPKAYMSWGWRSFLMLQKDDLGIDAYDREHSPLGVVGTTKLGLSWTY